LLRYNREAEERLFGPAPADLAHPAQVRQYLPGFVDPINIERERAEVVGSRELLALPWIKCWVDGGFTITCSPYPDESPKEYILEAVLPDLSKHYVAGFSSRPFVDLPSAVYGKKGLERIDPPPAPLGPFDEGFPP
jgi:hypothetical protein